MRENHASSDGQGTYWSGCAGFCLVGTGESDEAGFHVAPRPPSTRFFYSRRHHSPASKLKRPQPLKKLSRISYLVPAANQL